MSTQDSFAVVPFTRKLEEIEGGLTLMRHPKMATVETEAFKKASEEMALNVALNLRNQANITSKELVAKEIDELTSSANYYPISRKQLENIFKLDQLTWLCFINNVLSAIRTFCSPWYRPTVTVFGSVAFYMLLTATTWLPTTNLYCIIMQTLMCAGLFIGILAAIFVPTFKFQFTKISLVLDSIDKTEVKIPYGAKLKLLEAKDKGIFEDFVIAHPELENEKFEVTLRFPADPAILGVSRDHRMFMICWWDIQNDIDRVTRNIKVFKNFKIKA